ncbi:MAG: hypothetical protein IGS39_26780 [Calothrix sp. C42_A2020_038]|nr:hypothetical protein [Calothrix sp. C42_A2020_038]
MIKHLMIALSITALTGLSPATGANQTNLSSEKLSLAQSRTKQTPKASLVSHTKARLGGISLSMTEAQVRRILGRPKSVRNENSPAVGKLRFLQYQDISVGLVEDVNKPNSFSVYRFSTKSRRYSTPDGIRVGDNRAKVIKAYGQVSPRSRDRKTYLSYQIDLQDIPAALIFEIEAGRVTEISCIEQLT